ncbi:MAG: EipA family protein [Hyphomicrobium sp.]
MRSTFAVVLFLVALAAVAPPSVAATCTAKDFATAVDQSGASLRTLTLEAQPKLQERLRRYKEALNLNDTDYENSALDAIQDTTLNDYDSKSSELLMRVDSLGRVPEGSQPDCAKLDEVKLAAARLNTVIKAKSDYMLKRLDEKIAEAKRASPPPSSEAAGAAKTAPSPSAASNKPAAPVSGTASKSPAKPAVPPSKGWATHTKPDTTTPPPTVAMIEPDPPPGLPPPEQEGFTIDEIRDVTRGFFGTVSTNLAAVIEHAFKQAGRPTAYVLGVEGGGAFLAGLRFGKGTLFMRSQPDTREVYWHGPSLGTDLGASGSRTLFLIYRMNSPNDLYRSFTGIDGSAYFVGGVGVTLLKGGPVIMAPIRSGVGMRLGANVGYLRFTETSTWNPF